MSTDLVIILSSDWVGSTATRAEVGEEPADALQEVHDALLRRIIDAADGRVVKHSGDGVLAIFHSATAAVNAALRMHEDFASISSGPDTPAPMRLRVGLAAGDVKHQSGDIFGLPVIEAVRLQSIARPGETLCSDLVRVLTYGRGGFDFDAAGTHELKGLPKPMQALRVTRSARAAIERPRAADSSAVETKTTAARAWPRRYGIAGAIALVAAAIAAFLTLRDDPAAPARAASSTATPSAASPDAMPNSVAVLPCENLSPNESDKYFAAGIHEEIVSELQKLSALAVINRRSVLRYADTSTSVADIARELRVQAVMQCSVRYAGVSVRITAQLIDPSTGVTRWSDVYSGQLDDIFAIQADVATNIAGALRAQLSPSDAQALERRPTSSPEAYRLYLEARSMWQQPGFNSGETIHLLVDRALQLDDRFASAYALKAAAYLASLTNNVVGDAVTPAEWPEVERRVRDYANRALALDPSEQTARDVLRAINISTWNWTAFEQGLERRDEDHLRFQPLWMLSWMGKPEQAVRAGQRGVLLNPNDAGAEYSLGVVHGYAGDFEAARQRLVRASELSPDDPLVRALIAYNAIARADHDLALTELQLVEQLLGRNRPVIFLAELAYSYSRIGRDADAERLYKEIEALGDSAAVGVGTWALASLAVGDTAGALRWLEAAAEKARKHEPDQGIVSLMNLRMNFQADPLLGQPQFADVLERIRGS